MIFELSTNLVPIVDVNTYPDYQSQIREDAWSDFEKIIVNKAEEYINNALSWTRHFKDIKVKLQKMQYPQEYNYGGDWINFDMEIPNMLVANIINDMDDNFFKWIKENYKSYDGYINLSPTTRSEWYKSFESPRNIEKARAIAQVIMYEVGKELKLETYAEQFNSDINETIFDQDLVEES